MLSATVIANSAAEADALATAILVMGREKSLELIEKNPSIEAYFISWDKDKGFVTEWTSGFEAYLTE